MASSLHAFVPAYSESPFLDVTLKYADLWADHIFVFVQKPFVKYGKQIKKLNLATNVTFHVNKSIRPFMNFINEGWDAFNSLKGYVIVLNPCEIIEQHGILRKLVKELPNHALSFDTYSFQNNTTFFDRCDQQPRVETKGFPIVDDSYLIWDNFVAVPSYLTDLPVLGAPVTSVANLNYWEKNIGGAILRPWSGSGFFNV